MAPPQTVDELTPILEELQKQTDRGMAIIATALVDEMLAEALGRRLILSNTLRDRMFSFDKNGSLSAFSEKIDMAYAIGLLKAEHRDDLHLMRRVRNRFAHHLQPIDFSDAEVKAHCDSLMTCRLMKDWTTLPTRVQFSAAFTMMLTVLRIVRSDAQQLALDECHVTVDRVVKVCIEAITSDRPLTVEMVRAAQVGIPGVK